MKKIMLILLVLSASAFLTGCCCNSGGEYNPCNGTESIGNWY